MINLILLAAVPALLLLVTIVSIVVCIYIFAKAHGNVRGLEGKRKSVLIFFACLPLIMLGLLVILMSSSVNTAHNKLSEDVASGAVTLHKVADIVDSSKTQKITVPISDTIRQLSFEIFQENLYIEQKGESIEIKTKEFDGIEEITKNRIASIYFIQPDPKSLNKNLNESGLQKDKIKYTRQETAIGTVFQYDKKDTREGSGDLVFEMFFNDSNYLMRVNVPYNTENDLRVRYSPVVSRAYADKLYQLITSTLNLQIATPQS